MYIEKGMFSNKNTANNHEFYLSDKRDLESEWLAALDQFKRPLPPDADVNQHALCRFPARARYLQKKAGLRAAFDESRCRNFQIFKNKINLEQVSLIFSSYFIDNPSSAFGHTLLRLKQKGVVDTELLDYGINYAAIVTTKNPLLYGVFGLIGGFQGSFTMLPYFFKIREYNDVESRDLWEYQLNFTPDEAEFFVAHLWELDRALFTYYYLRENCSYMILKLLNVVRPDTSLSDQLGTFVVPVDTVQAALKAQGFVANVLFRPSQDRKMKARLGRLSKDQHHYELLAQPIRQKNLTANVLKEHLHDLPATSQANVLDALIDLADFTYPKELLLEQGADREKIKNMKDQLLLARSQLSEVDYVPLAIERPPSPDQGHHSRRASLGTSHSDARGSGIDFAYRFALHEPLDAKDGHNANTELEMGNFKLSYLTTSHRLYVQDARIASVLARRSFDLTDYKMSWLLRFGAKDFSDTPAIELAPYLQTGTGPTFFFGKNFMTSFMLTNQLAWSGDFARRNCLIDLGLGSSLVWYIHPKLHAQNDVAFARIFTSQKRWRKENTFSLQWNALQDWSMQFSYQTTFGQERNSNLNQVALKLSHYFF